MATENKETATSPDVVKVTMNMGRKTLDDIEVISQLTHNTNRTNIVGTALRLYRRLLELQEKDDGKLIVEDKKGNLTRMELVH
ncbi:hypothetical protein [Ohtaekwangia sp.]|uniref:hypothetical protein n=1 Tax=Ohtaekwangia sp. TaxID=2066019 RepID=UPI002F925C72